MGFLFLILFICVITFIVISICSRKSDDNGYSYYADVEDDYDKYDDMEEKKLEEEMIMEDTMLDNGLNIDDYDNAPWL